MDTQADKHNLLGVFRPVETEFDLGLWSETVAIRKESNRAFIDWYAECVCICINEHVGPDNYRWNIYDCELWKDMFEQGLSAREAVMKTFRSR